MLAKVKLALRISHTALDNAIQMEIDAARQEMIRAGVASNKAQSTADPLITRAIITYCRMEHSSDQKTKDGYQKSFDTQLDNLRKSVDYMEE